MSTTATLQSAELDLAAVSPNQKYWDKGLACFNDGDIATTAIQKVWAAMAPPASLAVCASIIGALYADTYWATTKMDKSLLATDLQAALGINPTDCQKAAAAAFAKWYGLLVRANFADAGAIPRGGSLTVSPDVVTNGKAQLTVQQLITQWNVYTWDAQPGLKNNAYGRAQSVNIQQPIKTPQLRMFFTDAGFVPPPTSWVQMFTFDGEPIIPLEGIQAGPVPVGGKVANAQSFAFTPPGSGHYCALAVVATEFFANNPLDTPGNWNSQEWIQSNGAAGWHNTDVLSAKEATLKFYNQDGVAERFVFEAHCRNVPVGTVVSLESTDKRLAHPLRTPEMKITRAYQVVTTEAEIPPNFAGDLKLHVEGQPLPANASIDVRMDWRLQPGHEHYLRAVDQLADTRAVQNRDPVRVSMGNFTFIGK